jgi:hypothetical protein
VKVPPVPVSWAIVLVESLVLIVAASLLLGRVFVPFGALAFFLVALLMRRRRQRESGPMLD